MKKLILIILVFLSSFLQAQHREISIDIGDALIMRTLEISYEQYISNQNTFGLSALFNFNNGNSDVMYNEDTMITPFFRHYFTNYRNWNCFGEIFLGINSGEKDNTEYIDGALGISIGLKYIANGGLTISPLIGIGRNMFTDDSYEFVPRAGINIGYNF